MQTIYKYPLEVTDAQRIAMPEGANILTVQMQHGQPCLWAEVDTEKPLKDRVIETFGTGNPMWVDMGVQRKYIGTYQDKAVNGILARHVFEAEL